MKIFVAASWARKKGARDLAVWLGMRHTVISRWLAHRDEAGGGKYVADDDVMAQASRQDREDLAQCDALVMMNGDGLDNRSRGGKHTEFGMAIQAGKMVFVYGPREGVHEWGDGVVVCENLGQLADALAKAETRLAEKAKPEPITTEAHRITNRERRDVYGHPFDDFSRIGQMWAAILGTPVTAEQVGSCMIAVKLGRLCHSPGHRDSHVDIAGYANCLDMIRQRREEA